MGGWVAKNKVIGGGPPNVISFGLKESADRPIAGFAFETPERVESLRSQVAGGGSGRDRVQL